MNEIIDRIVTAFAIAVVLFILFCLIRASIAMARDIEQKVTRPITQPANDDFQARKNRHDRDIALMSRARTQMRQEAALEEARERFVDETIKELLG